MLDIFPRTVVEHAPVLIVVIPLLFALITTIVSYTNERLALPLTIVAMSSTFVAALITLVRVLNEGAISYHLGGWSPPIGISYNVDHLNAPVLLMITVVSLLTAIYSKEVVKKELPGKIVPFYVIYTLSVTGLVGMTITGDVFNLYVLL